MQRSLWISFDLGVRGDYEGMYTWLDTHNAIECGDNTAYIKFEFTGDLIESLRKDFKESVEVTKKTRIYVVWQDPVTHSTKGKFILGNRKAPPWTGYAASADEEESESVSDES